MKIEEILSGDKKAMSKFANFYRNQTSFSNGASKIMSGQYNIKKLKMEPGAGLLVVPMVIQLPITFDGKLLEDGTQVSYLGSFNSVVKMIKLLCTSNSDYADALQEVLGENYEKISLTNLETINDNERLIFKAYRKPLVYAHTVMPVKAMDSKFQFPTTYRVDLITDPETGKDIDDPRNPLIYKLYKLEAHCVGAMVKQLKEENEAKGAEKRTDSEIEATVKNMWDTRCIKNPYVLGTARVLFIGTNKSFDVEKDDKGKWKGDVSSVKNLEYYIKVNKKILDDLDRVIGSKYDKYEDFLLIKQTTPDFDEKDRGNKSQQISRVGAGTEEAIEVQLTGFIEAYRAYRDNIDDWDEKIILKSAFEYRTITDATIKDIFKNRMNALSSAMKTEEIAEKYSDIIGELDAALSQELLQSAMTGDLTQVGDVSSEVDAAPVVDENTPGYGGDDYSGAEIMEDMTAALAD